jgi:hypothetical protein
MLCIRRDSVFRRVGVWPDLGWTLLSSSSLSSSLANRSGASDIDMRFAAGTLR